MARDIRRIAMLSVHTCPLATLGGKKTGGMNVYVRELSRELARQGIGVDVFTRSQDPCQPHVNDTLSERARVIHILAGPESPLDTHDLYPHLPQFAENVLSFAARNRLSYDLVFSHYWLSGWVAHILRAEWQIPVLQMFHTLGHMKNRVAPDQSEHPSGVRDIRVFTETDIMSWADGLIAATPAEHAQMLWLYNADRRKIHIVPPGVDTRHFCPIDRDTARAEINIPLAGRMFLFVGRVERLKGLDTILLATRKIQERRPDLSKNICITLIGGDLDDPASSNTEVARLQAIREELQLHDIVTFVGARDQDRLRYYYNAAEALIMPSDYESFGMVALEAMACGTPVIASEVGGLAYLVRDGETGFHVPVREPDALAARMIAILEDDQLRKRMSQAAYQAAQEFDWSAIAGHLLEIFRALPEPFPKPRPAPGSPLPPV